MRELAGAFRIVIVAGVSGSGKSTIAAALAARLGCRYTDADGFHPPRNIAKLRAGEPLSDADRTAWLADIATWIDETRAADQRAVIACSALKRAYRDVLIGDRGDVRLVFLTGSAELIAARLARREGHFMPASLLESQFATLELPDADERAIVVSIEPSPSTIVDTILRRLSIQTEEQRRPPR